MISYYSKRFSEIFIEKTTFEEIVEKILESNDENKLIDSYIDILANFFWEICS